MPNPDFSGGFAGPLGLLAATSRTPVFPAAIAERGVAALARMTQPPKGAMSPASAERRGALYELRDGVAIIPVTGVLEPGSGFIGWDFVTGYDDLRWQAGAAMNDDAARAVAFLIESNGGYVDGLWPLVDDLAAMRGDKPMVALCASAYSAAYAIASACDRVIASPYGGVGSIGTVMVHLELSRALKEFGIGVSVFRAPDGKARGGPFEALDDATKAEFQEAVDELTGIFAARVAHGRGGAISAEDALATNARCFDTPSRLQQALALGLIDQVRPLEEAFAELANFVNAA